MREFKNKKLNIGKSKKKVKNRKLASFSYRIKRSGRKKRRGDAHDPIS